MSGTKNNTQKKNRKTCKLGIASLVLGPAYFYALLAHYLLKEIYLPSWWGSSLFVTFVFISAPVGLTLGIMALIRIKRSKGLLKGQAFAIAGVIAFAVMTLFLSQ